MGHFCNKDVLARFTHSSKKIAKMGCFNKAMHCSCIAFTSHHDVSLSFQTELLDRECPTFYIKLETFWVKLKAWSTAMTQPVETTTILNAQPFWMLFEMTRMDRRTDATKCIIFPASRSIIMSYYNYIQWTQFNSIQVF